MYTVLYIINSYSYLQYDDTQLTLLQSLFYRCEKFKLTFRYTFICGEGGAMCTVWRMSGDVKLLEGRTLTDGMGWPERWPGTTVVTTVLTYNWVHKLLPYCWSIDIRQLLAAEELLLGYAVLHTLYSFHHSTISRPPPPTGEGLSPVKLRKTPIRTDTLALDLSLVAPLAPSPPAEGSEQVHPVLLLHSLKELVSRERWVHFEHWFTVVMHKVFAAWTLTVFIDIFGNFCKTKALKESAWHR